MPVTVSVLFPEPATPPEKTAVRTSPSLTHHRGPLLHKYVVQARFSVIGEHR